MSDNGRKDGAVFGQRSGTISEKDAQDYLMKFGYLSPSNLKPRSRRPGPAALEANSLESALKTFQGFYGLEETGRLDDQTRGIMAKRRCGVQDGVTMEIQSSNLERKWTKHHLTYSIVDYTLKITSTDVRKILATAFHTWARVTPLYFTEVPKGEKADILVRFAAGRHGDPWPFDGESGTLAHATFPEDGKLHFDDDEPWTNMTYGNAPRDHTDLLSVAIHEIGHILGLEHSRYESAIMYALYNAPIGRNGEYVRPALSMDDIRSIQALYGTNSREDVTIPPTTDTPTSTTGGSTESVCIVKIDAIAAMPAGSGYIFAGDKVYVYDTTTNKITRQSTMADLFPSGPPKVNAAVYNPRNSTMLLILGKQIWGYHFVRGAFTPVERFPKNLPAEIPWTPTGALIWPSQHQLLLGPNRSFSIYDEIRNVSTMLEKTDNYFKGLPDNARGAVSAGGKYFVFTSEEVFEYDEKAAKSHSGRLIGDVIQC